MDKFNLLKLTKPNLYLFGQDFTKEEKDLIKKNIHGLDYFIKYSKLTDCTCCLQKHKLNYLQDKDIIEYIKKKGYPETKEKCDIKCEKKSISYPLIVYPIDKKYFTKNVDALKKIEEYKQDKLIYKLNEIDYTIKYELTVPSLKTVVHWGQLKLFLTTLIFLVKTVKRDEQVHIVYPGSARGDNILICCDMFPNTIWYLIDPNRFNEKIYNHPQIKETRNEYFTDELAHYYAKLLKKEKKVLFMSDIRVDNEMDDNFIIRDQEMNRRWYEIINPEYGYLKFRTLYFQKKYEYLEGDIYLQPYAPSSSTETRLLLKKGCKMKVYNCEEYGGKLFYFNRILRSSSYKPLIKNHEYLDTCWDCVYFSYIIKNYLIIYNIDTSVEDYCNQIIDTITKKCINRIREKTKYVKDLLKF
jgi:hypothetical protein